APASPRRSPRAARGGTCPRACPCCTRPARRPRLEVLERVRHHPLVELHHRVAVRRLVARRQEGVHGERIVVRGGQLLLGQGAHHPLLHGRQLHALTLT